MIFKAFGINFKISYIFTLSLAIFIAADKTGNIIPLLIATLAHELGHLVCMSLLKAKPSEINLTLGTIRIVNNTFTTNNETLLILLAGPLANLALFLVFINLKGLELFAIINLVIFLFNLLPIEGLDGGSILRLSLRIKHTEKFADRVLFAITMVFSAILIFVFTYLLLNGTVNYSIPILILYLIVPLILKKTC